VTIGQVLTAARESAGLTVEQVSAATRIRRPLVEAIEHDDLRLCGGDFYARGHIRNMAVAVGTDPAPLLAQFDAEHPQSTPPRAAEVFEPDTARPERRGPNWTASDAELEFDNGAALSWIASDFERNDDVGVPAGNGNTREAGDCRAVSLGAYALDELVHGDGNIQVRP